MPQRIKCISFNQILKLCGFVEVTHPVSTGYDYPDSKVHGANMGPTWGRQDPGGSHVGPINLAIWDIDIAWK